MPVKRAPWDIDPAEAQEGDDPDSNIDPRLLGPINLPRRPRRQGQAAGPPADQVKYEDTMGPEDQEEDDDDEDEAAAPSGRRRAAMSSVPVLAPGEVPAPTRQNLRYYPEWWGYFVDDGPKRTRERQYDYNWRIKRARVNMGLEMRVLPQAKTGGLVGNAVYSASQKQRQENSAQIRQHAQRMDSNDENYDAAYAADWRAKETVRKTRNQARRAAALAHANRYLRSTGSDRQLTGPVSIDDGGDDLYTERAPRTVIPNPKGKGKATANDDEDMMDVDDVIDENDDGWDEEDEVSDEAKQVYNSQFPEREKQQCKACAKFGRKGCSFREGKFPCTRCVTKGIRCVKMPFRRAGTSLSRSNPAISIPSWSSTPEGLAMIAQSTTHVIATGSTTSSQMSSERRSGRATTSESYTAGIGVGLGRNLPGRGPGRELPACLNCVREGEDFLCDRQRPCSQCIYNRSERSCVTAMEVPFDRQLHLEMRDEAHRYGVEAQRQTYATPINQNRRRPGREPLLGSDEMDIDVIPSVEVPDNSPPPPIIPRGIRGERLTAVPPRRSRNRVNPASLVTNRARQRLGDSPSTRRSNNRSRRQSSSEGVSDLVIRKRPPGQRPSRPRASPGTTSPPVSSSEMQTAIGSIAQSAQRVTRAVTARGMQTALGAGLQETRKRDQPLDEEQDDDEDDGEDDEHDDEISDDVSRPWAMKTNKQPKDWGNLAQRQRRTARRRKQPYYPRPRAVAAQTLLDQSHALQLRPVQSYDPPSRNRRDALNSPQPLIQLGFPILGSPRTRPENAIPYLYGPGPQSRDPPEGEDDCTELLPAWNDRGKPETELPNKRCRKQPVKPCDHVIDDLSCVCDPCHTDQTTKTLQRRRAVIERSKQRYCDVCAPVFNRNNPRLFTDRCYCIEQLTSSWICNAHYDIALNDLNLSMAIREEEFLRVSPVPGNLCLGCRLRPKPFSSSAWRCQNCRREVVSSTGYQ